MSAPYEEVSPSHRRCGQCQKVFSSRAGLADHFRMKHGRDPRQEDFLLVAKKRPKDDGDDSYADRAIQASMDRAMGIPTDDGWLLSD